MKSYNFDLFELIKSLSKSEKRYVSLYLSKNKSKVSISKDIFNFLVKLDQYDEKQVLAHFSKTDWVKHYAVHKKQLYYTILNGLHQFDEYANVEQDVKKGIHYCSILIKKGLFKQAKKLIDVYKKKAIEIEKFTFILELIELEKKMVTQSSLSGTKSTYVKTLYKEEKNCMDLLQNAAQYWERSNTIFVQHYRKKITKGQTSADFESLMKNKDFIDISGAKSTAAKLDFLQINALYAFVHNHTSKALEYNESLLSYLDKHEKMRAIFADRYFSVFNNYLIDSLILKKHDQLLNGIKRIRLLAKEKGFENINNLEANVFRLSYSLELNYHIAQGKFTEALPLITEVDKGLQRFKAKIVIQSSITLVYMLSYILFFNKMYYDCLDRILLIINEPNALKVKDIYRDTRFLEIICHFELGNYVLVESLVVSFNRFVSKEHEPYQTYSTLIAFVKASIRNPFTNHAKKYLAKLSELRDEEKEKIVFNNFDYLRWLSEKTDSKI